MSLTEEKRINLANSARAALREENGNSLMEVLPPVGWADVATKKDLDALAVLTKADIDAQTALLRADVDKQTALLRADMKVMQQAINGQIYKVINRWATIYLLALTGAVFALR